MTYQKEDYDEGMKLILSSVKRNAHSHMTYLKSLNYADNLLEKQKAIQAGYHEALFLNTEGFVAEGSMTNLFFIKNGQIFTPDCHCGLLQGVIRKWVMTHYSVTEGYYTLEEVINSDGVFITNSILGIMKVMSIGDVPIRENDLIKNIHSDYNKYLEVYGRESTH